MIVRFKVKFIIVDPFFLEVDEVDETQKKKKFKTYKERK